MLQIFDMTANENARYKRNELESYIHNKILIDHEPARVLGTTLGQICDLFY